MIEFYWYDLILIPGIVQGLFLGILLLHFEKGNHSANKILAVILFISALMLVGRLVWLRYPPEWSFLWSLIPDTTIFIFGPLLYLYFKRLLFESNIKLFFLHITPAILHLAVVGVLFSLTPEVFGTYWNNGTIPWYLFGVESSAIVLNIAYWLMAFNQIRKYIKLKKNQLSFDLSITRYLGVFHFTVLAFLFIWALGFMNTRFIKSELYLNPYDLIWIMIPVLIYVIGYFSLKKPHVFQVHAGEEEAPNIQINRLNQDEVHAIQSRLDHVMGPEKVYQNSDLTLSSLAKQVGTSANNLSWLLNEVYCKTFYDYINGLRIKEYIRRLGNGEHQTKTLLGLAMDVGFKAKSTFNKVFKEELGTTPSTYVKGLSVTQQKYLMSQTG